MLSVVGEKTDGVTGEMPAGEMPPGGASFQAALPAANGGAPIAFRPSIEETQALDGSLVGSRFWLFNPDLLGVLRNDGFFESANPAWQVLLGWSEEELRRTSMFELLHPDDRERTLGGLNHLKRGYPVLRFENRYRGKDGRYLWFAWSAVPYGDAYYCAGRDITNDRLRAARLATSEDDLRIERRDAELRDQFIAILGHDLRNPLAAIASGINLLESEVGSEAAKILGMMQAAGFRMQKLVENMLDFARGRLGGGIELDRQADLDLQPVIAQVIDELRTAMPGRSIEMNISLPRRISADRARIGQLVSNLLANALTHGALGTPVRFAATTHDGLLEMSMANEGKPIPPAAMERLFQPFFRMSEHGGREGGLGLGLHIASEIAKAHGGVITAQSTIEETRFTFRMPI